ncbi:MAG: transcription antitermination factor NusB [Clostridia bacterium]|nr:transcription antitermination factor NusB [Clostridia bacterium]
MNRTQSREQAFIFLFESTFGFNSAEEIIDNAKLAREEKMNDFSSKLFNGALAHQKKIDSYIEKNIKHWSKDRLTRTALSVLRLAIFEMIFLKETPKNVVINEAVEIAKKYSTKEESSYVNGVLGAIANNLDF